MTSQKIDLFSHPAGVAFLPEFHRRPFDREPVTGSAAFRHVRARPAHVLHDDIRHGLSFGDLAISGGFGVEVGCEIPGWTYATVRELERAIRSVFMASGLDRHTTYTCAPISGTASRRLMVTVHKDVLGELSDDRVEMHAEHIAPGHRTLIEVDRFEPFPFRLRATCQEAADALFAAAAHAGLRTSPAHYSRMGAVPLEKFVDHALLWYAGGQERWFGEILWQHAYEKTRSWFGGTKVHHHEAMGSTRQLWSFASRDRPRIGINCLPVPFREIKEPTPAMEVLHGRSLSEKDFWQ